MPPAETRRRSGLLIPLFSCVSTRSWGIGDIGDLPAVSTWLGGAGQRALQLLPLNEMAPGQQSPYSAISAMAIDPIYLDLPAVPDFRALGGESSLDDDDRRRLAEVRASTRIDYAAVRRLKQRASRAAFARFVDVEWRRDTARAQALRAFIADESWWLDDYALFRAIHAREDERTWMEWQDPLKRRDPAALAEARATLADAVLRTQYRQWQAAEQWQRARVAARACHVELWGDLPFMVDGDSSDVWAHQDWFLLDASVGVPPDAFSETGQDWGMPVYRWDALAADDFRWLRDRARRAAELYDGFRIDHLVGFYRTYGRRRSDHVPFFTPADEDQQRALGERVLGVFREPGAEVVAEDLGTVPDFVRASLVKLGVPGFKVARWEREWNTPGQPFRDPADYAVCSVANSGTHDTETLAVWWTQSSRDEREAVARMPTVARVARGIDVVAAPYDPVVRDILLESLFAAGSELLVLPVQDVFGWHDRINQPATVHEGNWSFKLPWPVDTLDQIPEARERQEALRRWAGDSGRAIVP